MVNVIPAFNAELAGLIKEALSGPKTLE